MRSPFFIFTFILGIVAPKAVARLRKPVPSAQFLDWQIAVCLPQETDNLFFHVSLLHVQSPSWLGLGFNVMCYSRWGTSILTGTPDVHESIIDLDISQELSSFVATTTGVNNSPTLLKRTVNSKLSIRSGEVVIFAGLNETKSDQTQSRFLGFSIGKQSSQGDTEILVFVEAQRI